jgi:hypothetical protein
MLGSTWTFIALPLGRPGMGRCEAGREIHSTPQWLVWSCSGPRRSQDGVDALEERIVLQWLLEHLPDVRMAPRSVTSCAAPDVIRITGQCRWRSSSRATNSIPLIPGML